MMMILMGLNNAIKPAMTGNGTLITTPIYGDLGLRAWFMIVLRTWLFVEKKPLYLATVGVKVIGQDCPGLLLILQFLPEITSLTMGAEALPIPADLAWWVSGLHDAFSGFQWNRVFIRELIPTGHKQKINENNADEGERHVFNVLFECLSRIDSRAIINSIPPIWP